MTARTDLFSRTLADSIRDATGAAFELLETTPVAGGCIHTALQLSGRTASSAPTYFVKVNAADRAPMFAAEADGLRALASAGAVRTPEVIAQGDDGEQAFLVLEWLDLAPLDAASGTLLGHALAAQHRIAQERFGWASDNFIGATPQTGGWSDDWLSFWRERRLQPQLRLAAKNRYPSKMIDRGERLVADCEAFFTTYAPARSLLHGDLWGGNAAAFADGTPALFDPAVYVGDREADLAMTELFGGFPSDFQSAYRNAWPLDDGYRARRGLYNTYHLLNHANLFSGDYVAQAARAIEKVIAEIR